MSVFAHFGDGSRADACHGTEIFLFDVLINEEFPEFLITDCHNHSPSDIAKALLSAGLLWYGSMLPTLLQRRTSVVIYYNSELGRGQEKIYRFARFMLKKCFEEYAFRMEYA